MPGDMLTVDAVLAAGGASCCFSWPRMREIKVVLLPLLKSAVSESQCQKRSTNVDKPRFLASFFSSATDSTSHDLVRRTEETNVLRCESRGRRAR
jgi:hypothetical protein